MNSAIRVSLWVPHKVVYIRQIQNQNIQSKLSFDLLLPKFPEFDSTIVEKLLNE